MSSEMTTCKHCGQAMAAKGSNNAQRVFCSSRCNGDYRRALNAAKRAAQEQYAAAKVESNTAGLQAYMTRMRASAERQRRAAVARGAVPLRERLEAA